MSHALLRGPRPDHPARLADAATYARLFELWSRARHRESLTTFQLGGLQPRRSLFRRRGPVLPLVELVMPSGPVIDLAHPRTGFAGLHVRPAPERVITLWADNLLSVHHGEEWVVVVDPPRAFDRAWLEQLTPTDTPRPRYAVVTATVGAPTPVGAFRTAQVEATAYTTLVHLDDRRAAPLRVSPAPGRAAGRAASPSRPG